MYFDLKDLALFKLIAESGNITKGSQRANLSTAAASIRIKGLEDQLEAQLFHREARGVRLTSAGIRLLGHARQILDQVEQVRMDFTVSDDGSRGHVRIIANTTAVNEILPDVMSRFLSSRPGVSLELKEALNRDIVRAVLDGSADIGIVSDEIRGTGLSVVPFATDDLVLAVSPGHPLGHVREISFFDTLDEQHIGLHSGSSLLSFLQGVTRETGAEFTPRVQLYGFEAVCRMVESGIGIAVVPKSCADRYGQTMNFRQIRLSDNWARRRRCVIYREEELLSECARALVEEIRCYSTER